MKFSQRKFGALIISFLTALALGCDGTPPIDTSLTEVTVTGVVKVKGTPATGGQISFNPSNRDRKVSAFSAPIGADGSYTVKTYTGENEVRFAGDVDKAYPMIGMIKKFCIVNGSGQHEDFDLLSDADDQSPKLKQMQAGALKGKPGTPPRRDR
jgi:hypothetical protein